ncbi:MAG: hypothetical protein L0H96_06865 [Humibacillus sp.]|nr:hypothetical protein [Humibacillus sp.]MDN5776614.1 hypothetical protein [Humibacillus sp.]
MTRVDDPASSPVNSIKTYRYLRLAMPALVLLLFAALTIEWFAGGRRCVQESISSYYYTPAQGVFVGALVAIGACLVVIKGNTQTEDVLLNVAGMLAPVVAFVPTVHVGECRSVAVPVYDTSASIMNNIGALLVMGVAGVVVTGFVARGERVAGRPAGRSRMGLPAAVMTILVVAAGYFWARPTFFVKGHYVAALVMFACIVTVVLMNAEGLGAARGAAGATRVEAYLNRYALIAVLMVGSLVVMVGWRWATGWQHALLWAEGVLIVLFAVFWCVQTHELWNTIRRSRALGYAARPRRTPVSAVAARYSMRRASRAGRDRRAGRVDNVRRSARR